MWPAAVPPATAAPTKHHIHVTAVVYSHVFVFVSFAIELGSGSYVFWLGEKAAALAALKCLSQHREEMC